MSEVVDRVVLNVRTRMARDGWKIEPLAEFGGLDRSGLSNFLNRKVPNASLRYVGQIANALGCDLRDLLTPPAA